MTNQNITNQNVTNEKHDQPDDMDKAAGTVPSGATPTFAKAAGPFNITLGVVVVVIVIVVIVVVPFVIQLFSVLGFFMKNEKCHLEL